MFVYICSFPLNVFSDIAEISSSGLCSDIDDSAKLLWQISLYAVFVLFQCFFVCWVL